jgi:uncharacterized protein (TIGR02271 family)
MVSMAELRDGMKVRTSDGHDLGKIIRLDAGILVIEKGFFFPKDYEVPTSLVSEVRDDVALLSISRDALEREGGLAAASGAGEEGTGMASTAGTGADAGRSWSEDTRRRPGDPAAAGGAGLAGEATTETTHIPLAEEELEAQRRTREAGEVRVGKQVVTERRTIDVPVTREEVHVERVPASGAAEPGRDAFQEKTVSVPVHEEEVEITKRPRVREEVRVSKSRETVEQRAEADVRREEARIEGAEERGRAVSGSGEDEASRAGYGTPARDPDER